MSNQKVRTQFEIPKHNFHVSNVPKGISQGYCLRLALKCRQIKCRRIETRFGVDRVLVGESLNISSKNLLFSTTESFPVGQAVEASIDWPIRLNEQIPLTLVVEGAVVGSANNHTTMRIDRYQFRTRGYSEWSDRANSAPR